jgi:hypothetical protein
MALLAFSISSNETLSLISSANFFLRFSISYSVCPRAASASEAIFAISFLFEAKSFNSLICAVRP